MNNFKLKTKSNISNINPDAIYVVPGSVNSIIVLGLILSNKSSGIITATISLQSDTVDGETNSDVVLLNEVSIPNGSTLEVFAGQKLVLQPTDQLSAICNVANGLDVALSILEIS